MENKMQEIIECQIDKAQYNISEQGKGSALTRFYEDHKHGYPHYAETIEWVK